MSDAEFDRSFTGVVLRLEPGPEFRRERRVRRRVLTGARADGCAARCRALLYAVLAGLGLRDPRARGRRCSRRSFVDQVLVADQPGAIWPILGLLAGAALIVVAADRAAVSTTCCELETKLSLHSSGVFLWHVLRLPVAFFAQRIAGRDRRPGVAQRPGRACCSPSEVAAARDRLGRGHLLLRRDGQLRPRDSRSSPSAAAVINVVALRKVGRRRRDENLRVLQDSGALLGSAMSGIKSIETVKAAGREADFFARWAGLHAKAVSGAQRAGRRIPAAVRRAAAAGRAHDRRGAGLGRPARDRRRDEPRHARRLPGC